MSTSENLEESEHAHINGGVVVTVDFPLGGIWNYLGDKPLDLVVVECVDCINLGRKTHSNCELHNSMG